MPWQLLAIWVIVIATVTWFVRDEHRRRRDQDLERAARYYASAPRYQHVASDTAPVLRPRPRVGGLSDKQREFFRTLQR